MSTSRTTYGACSSGLMEESWDGQIWLLAAGCIGVSGVANMLFGWMQSRDGGTETRQGFGMLAGRLCVSVVVIVGTAKSWSVRCWSFLAKLLSLFSALSFTLAN